MLDKKLYIVDIEADNLLRGVTKVHCLSYQCLNTGESRTLTHYRKIAEFVGRDITLIGHNFIQYDKPVIQKLIDCNWRADVIDTLPLSWYIDIQGRKKFGLESYAEESGTPKPKISDWKNLSTEDYVFRCESDVKINTYIWRKVFKYLKNLYEGDMGQVTRLIRYLNFKMDCIREQEEVGIRFDKNKCQSVLKELQEEKEKRVKELIQAMPRVAIKKVKEYKDAVMDVHGNIAQPGELFFAITEAVKKVDKLERITGHKDGKPTSTKQLKDWLFSLGWKPENIQQKRNKQTGETKDIPQIKSKDNDGTVCPSVRKLFKKEPKLQILEGLAIISHRIGILQGFLKDEINGVLYASAVGITNTMRMRHKVIVNLPSVGKKYAEEIRSCLIAYEGHIICGSDLSNIEDRMKRSFIYKYDPEYVKEMSVPGFDAHLDLGMRANLVTQEEIDFYKWYERQKEDKDWKPTKEEKEKFGDIKAKRHKSKTTNFSATYKIGAPKLAHELNIKLREAKAILDAYWTRNKAIKQVEDSCIVKEIGQQKWLKNPINGFWYSLRNDKDKFSTLNQGSAAYIFDIWLTYIRKEKIKIGLQYHDECLINCLESDRERVTKILLDSMKKINDRFKFNVELGCSVDFGQSYWDVH